MQRKSKLVRALEMTAGILASLVITTAIIAVYCLPMAVLGLVIALGIRGCS